MIAILRMDQQGVVVHANRAATDLLGPCIGRRCCDAVLARSSNRHVVCRTDCASQLCNGNSSHDHRGTLVRGVPTRMICAEVGDEKLVILLGQGDQPISGLSPKECAVLALVAAGRNDTEIAEALGVQPSTVKTHVARARTKLGASTRAEAVALALRGGLIA
jgi:DNA-binding CsgD family transcriptional regulator